MPDWNVIKAEYVANPSATYRSLAESYKVSLRSLARKASAEKWPELRQQTVTKLTTEIVKKNTDAAAKRYKNFNTAADKLLRKIIRSINEVDTKDISGLRKLAAAMKDMKDCIGIRLETADTQTESACGVLLLPATIELPVPEDEDL